MPSVDFKLLKTPLRCVWYKGMESGKLSLILFLSHYYVFLCLDKFYKNRNGIKNDYGEER